MSKLKFNGCGCIGCMAILFILSLLGVIFFILWRLSFTALQQNQVTSELPDHSSYAVQGVDVSAYQGKIDWSVLADNNIQFAFIKATEGSDYVDENFSQNLSGALKTPLKIGAYHFFNFDESGLSQAQNFINTVPKNESMLPPVVDIEFYPPYNRFLPPSSDSIVNELRVFLNTLETHYGKRPIIYTSKYPYSVYIEGQFEDYKLWIANYDEHPVLSDGREWTFWQYSEHGILPGYSGAVEYIDLNVYRGSWSDFKKDFSY